MSSPFPPTVPPVMNASPNSYPGPLLPAVGAPQYANLSEVIVSDTEVSVRFAALDHFTQKAYEARLDVNDPALPAMDPRAIAARPIATVMMSREGAQALLEELKKQLGADGADAGR